MKQNPSGEILVLDEQGNNLGKMPYHDAQNLASDRNLDLVSINKKGGIEVFKIMDHGKWKYEKKKNKQKQKKSSLPIKEMNFKMRIDPHDQEIKINRIKSFLSKGADVKITVTMRGREKANARLAHDKMNEILASFGETVQIQQQRSSPSVIFATIRPVKGKKDESLALRTSGQLSDRASSDSERKSILPNNGNDNGNGNGKESKENCNPENSRSAIVGRSA